MLMRISRQATDIAHSIPGLRAKCWRWDWPALAASAIAALVVGLASPVHTSQRTWGLIATVGYACAGLAAARSSVRWPHLAGFIAVIGTVAMPLVWLTVAGLEQMEVGVVERGADS